MDGRLVEILEDPHTFHFKQEWLDSTDTETRTLLEIFSFGTIKDLTDDLRKEMSPAMIAKLQKLTIISLSEQCRVLTYETIANECLIDNMNDVENFLIQLQGFFRVRLDSVERVAKITDWFDCRDVYANERDLYRVHNLQISKESLIQDLKKWKSKLTQDILG
ncbi:hypothetical protein KAFR_0B06080 [Kazachstania africana CBS 2517]|uniref:COP9 signalosome complex subunit 9 n=1 Tax=Kazachstania africana (strain ATCC 22294 / BCRC 22015 / CBS 2517 / CECT 1963 / NBRC 1671 / NRRL Y-8276) TaxID=1071382 RepID=H2ARA4_KAZAF|nr:hypothetical protein KAFR_0B06080 [Kazachstania africana CBS 2517]CCF56904.1 hypothetical protein KAFR_0B06080 [Kazachstania africana CBS 2517]